MERVGRLNTTTNWLVIVIRGERWLKHWDSIESTLDDIRTTIRPLQWRHLNVSNTDVTIRLELDYNLYAGIEGEAISLLKLSGSVNVSKAADSFFTQEQAIYLSVNDFLTEKYSNKGARAKNWYQTSEWDYLPIQVWCPTPSQGGP